MYIKQEIKTKEQAEICNSTAAACGDEAAAEAAAAPSEQKVGLETNKQTKKKTTRLGLKLRVTGRETVRQKLELGYREHGIMGNIHISEEISQADQLSEPCPIWKLLLKPLKRFISLQDVRTTLLASSRGATHLRLLPGSELEVSELFGLP